MADIEININIDVNGEHVKTVQVSLQDEDFEKSNGPVNVKVVQGPEHYLPILDESGDEDGGAGQLDDHMDDQHDAPIEPRKVWLFIKTLTGRTHEVCVNSHSTIKQLRLAVEIVSGIPPDEQRLIHAGKQLLEDSWTLAKCKIGHNSTLLVVLRLRGT